MKEQSLLDYMLRKITPSEIMISEDGSMSIDVSRLAEEWDQYGRTDIGLEDLAVFQGAIIPQWPVHPGETGVWLNNLNYVWLDGELVRRLKTAGFYMDEGVPEVCSVEISNTNCPWYMIRGESITREQVKTILRQELPLLADWEKFVSKEDWWFFNSYLLGQILPQRDFLGGGAQSWLRESGEIGINTWNSIKYPEFEEIIPDWLYLAVQYPFLNMAIGYTTYDGRPCFFCPLKDLYESAAYKYLAESETVPRSQWTEGMFACRMNRIRECEGHFRKVFPSRKSWESRRQRYQELSEEERGRWDYDENYNDFIDLPEYAEEVCMTIQVNKGTLRLWAGENARRVYREYDRKYGFSDRRRYSNIWNKVSGEPFLKEGTLRSLLREKGLDADQCMDDLVNKGGMQTEYMKDDWKLPDWLDEGR